MGLLLPTAALADSAPADQTNPATPTTVTADALPTVQINGVAWAQVVVGNTVYVAGSFTTARPAGAPKGTQETVRNNLLAYDIRSGNLITSFTPDLNAQALALAASPDGSRIYVGGDFTQANGQVREHIAAYDTATGSLVTDFRPAVDSTVRAIAAANTTVYIGGDLSAVGTTARTKLAAVSASNGALLPWAPQPGVGSTAGNTLPKNPTANAQTSNGVLAMVLAGPDGQVVVGGRFDSLNGVKATGVGALDGTTGATRPFAVNSFLTNQGVNSAVYSLSTDGTDVFGTAYDYYGPGDLEGPFVAAADGGAVRWFADCRGDTYSSFSAHGVVYTASHTHDCRNIGGFKETSPISYQHANAFSLAAAGVNTTANNWNGARLAGQPAPAELAWSPKLNEGSYTGQYQAGWSVTGNAQYVVYGGEFPEVNGTNQQGLVRFAVSSLAANAIGPDVSRMNPSATAVGAGAVRLSWTAASDQDNENLVYRVYRDGGSTPIYQVTQASTWWKTPAMVIGETGLTAGSHSYQVTVSDPMGNTASSATVAVPVATAGQARPYADAARADGAIDLWSLGERSGSTAYDLEGTNDMTVGSSVTEGAAGALTGDGDTAFTFTNSATSTAAAKAAAAAPQTFTVEAWIKTTTETGGRIVGYSSSTTGSSSSYDRMVYLDTNGRLNFGVYTGVVETITSSAAVNDGTWHHVAASLGSGGMALYVDGGQVAARSTVTSAQAFNGAWRIGADSVWSGAASFTGSIDEVAVYPTALTADQLAAHVAVARTGKAGNTAPAAAFSSSVSDLSASVDGSSSTDVEDALASWAWEFGDGGTGTGRTATHVYAAAGTYTVTLTVTDAAGATGTVSRSVTVTAPPTPPAPGVLASDAFAREVIGGWGSANFGGAWTLDGKAADAAVAGGSGRLTSMAAVTTTQRLGISGQDVSVQADVTLEKAPTGGGSFVSLGSRTVGSTRYSTQLWFAADGTVTLSLVSVVNGAESELASYRLAGKYTAGTTLTVRTEAIGNGTTTLRARAWTTGTTEPAAWQVSATNSTVALQKAGGVAVELYVSKSATSAQTLRLDELTVGAPSVAPTNTAPTAAFTSAVSDLTTSVDGSSSTDAEGAIASWAWEFGDGTTGTGKTATHAYTAAGTHTVKLTVTDAAGATGTVSKSVTVTAPVAPPASGVLATDAFDREVTGGWGPADSGGAWTIDGKAANAVVTGGSGRLAAAAATSTSAVLATSAQDVAVQADVLLASAPTGGGSYVSLGSRNVGGSRYNTQLWFGSDGTVVLSLVAVVDWAETEVASYTLPEKYAAGTTLTVRSEASGSSTTTLHASAWAAGSTEPAAWQLTATDTTAGLQRAGGVRVELYQGKSATATQTLQVDNAWIGVAGTKP